MAACTTYDLFRVVSAGNNLANGFYYPTSGYEALGFSIFSFFNTIRGYPCLRVFNLSGADYAWGLFLTSTLSAYRSSEIYTSLSLVPDCPQGLSWVFGTQTTGTYPNVMGKTTQEVHREIVNLLYSGAAPIGGLENNSVTTDKILNGAVTSSKLADGSVINSKLGNRSVTFKKLANELKDAVDYNHSPAFPQGFSPIW